MIILDASVVIKWLQEEVYSLARKHDITVQLHCAFVTADRKLYQHIKQYGWVTLL